MNVSFLFFFSYLPSYSFRFFENNFNKLFLNWIEYYTFEYDLNKIPIFVWSLTLFALLLVWWIHYLYQFKLKILDFPAKSVCFFLWKFVIQLLKHAENFPDFAGKSFFIKHTIQWLSFSERIVLSKLFFLYEMLV